MNVAYFGTSSERSCHNLYILEGCHDLSASARDSLATNLDSDMIARFFSSRQFHTENFSHVTVFGILQSPNDKRPGSKTLLVVDGNLTDRQMRELAFKYDLSREQFKKLGLRPNDCEKENYIAKYGYPRRPGGECVLCHAKWADVPSHNTKVTSKYGMFAVCKDCWEKMPSEFIIAAYHRVFNSWEEDFQEGLKVFSRQEAIEALTEELRNRPEPTNS